MLVKDYDLINNIDKIFSSSIMLLGLGYRGKQIFSLLNQIPIDVKYVYDRKLEENTYLEAKVIKLDEVKEIISKENCMIIIGSHVYKEELIDALEKQQIDCSLYTWYGVKTAIELNVDSNKFSNAFRDDLLFRKRLFFHNFETSYWLKHFMDFSKSYNPILIYQAGKVGSSTIKYTLDGLKIENIHLHNFMQNRGIEKGLCGEIVRITNEQMEYFRKQLLLREVRIITLVRDPIGREVSLFMQEFHEDYILHDIDKSLLEYANGYITNNLLLNIQFEWFNKEIKELTGIDIYSYPFDKKKGYAIIEEKNFKILVLKMETMNQNEKIIGDFVGEKNLTLKRNNIGSEKHYQYIYQGLKEDFRISKETFQKAYMKNSYFDHFYTEEEKQNFMKKWEKNIE